MDDAKTMAEWALRYASTTPGVTPHQARLNLQALSPRLAQAVLDLSAEVERLAEQAEAPLKPGGFRWLTGWVDWTPETSERYAAIWPKGSDTAPWVITTYACKHGLGWAYRGHERCVDTLEEAKAAAESWAEERWGNG